MDGRKIYFNDWLKELIKNIMINKSIHEMLLKEKIESDKGYHERGIDICERLLEKIEKYKKVDEEGHIYLWLFPSELEDIMWIYMENVLALLPDNKEDDEDE